jgi:hypothetical protein
VLVPLLSSSLLVLKLFNCHRIACSVGSTFSLTSDTNCNIYQYLENYYSTFHTHLWSCDQLIIQLLFHTYHQIKLQHHAPILTWVSSHYHVNITGGFELKCKKVG